MISERVEIALSVALSKGSHRAKTSLVKGRGTAARRRRDSGTVDMQGGIVLWQTICRFHTIALALAFPMCYSKDSEFWILQKLNINLS